MSDMPIRLAAFEWLARRIATEGDMLPWKELVSGFTFLGSTVPLVSSAGRGIWKPKSMALPISLLTSVKEIYNDGFSQSNMLQYKYQGNNPDQFDNNWMRELRRTREPIVYFLGVSKGIYMPIWPVFVVGDDRINKHVFVQCDSMDSVTHYQHDNAGFDDSLAADSRDPQRAYITRITRQRVHQGVFRELVLAAYQRQCAFCHFRHEEMLDAAHIIPDSHPDGEPVVRNGLSLCSLHHRAFDHNILGVSRDYIIHVRPDVLKEKDGPILAHGIQAMNNRLIELPRKQIHYPDPDALQHRFEQFLSNCS
jgi:putative restriction endonuclease